MSTIIVYLIKWWSNREELYLIFRRLFTWIECLCSFTCTSPRKNKFEQTKINKHIKDCKGVIKKTHLKTKMFTFYVNVIALTSVIETILVFNFD